MPSASLLPFLRKRGQQERKAERQREKQHTRSRVHCRPPEETSPGTFQKITIS
jgi:hypothetical protein